MGERATEKIDIVYRIEPKGRHIEKAQVTLPPSTELTIHVFPSFRLTFVTVVVTHIIPFH